VSEKATSYTIGSVTSAGTTIGFRQLGSGPGLLLLHGGMQASQHYIRLAAALADTFTVYLPDRRGRGLSGPPGEPYSMVQECADVAALLDQTGAHSVFGHSAGGLIALQAALTLPSIHKVAVYEPPLSVHGSVPTSWVKRYEREVEAGKSASAMITALKGLQLSRIFTLLPRPVLLLLITLLAHREKQTLQPNDISMEALVPTGSLDLQLFHEMEDTLDRFAGMRAEVLLLGGEKSPVYLRDALTALSQTVPQVKRIEYPGLDHSGPNVTAPERVASDLRAFFSPVLATGPMAPNATAWANSGEKSCKREEKHDGQTRTEALAD
jgi:pimeloyl-ACP methyl ester carboxylesterase